MDGMLDLDSMPLVGLLHRSVARLKNLGLIGVQLIYNIISLIKLVFFISFGKFYAGLHVPLGSYDHCMMIILHDVC